MKRASKLGNILLSVGGDEFLQIKEVYFSNWTFTIYIVWTLPIFPSRREPCGMIAWKWVPRMHPRMHTRILWWVLWRVLWRTYDKWSESLRPGVRAQTAVHKGGLTRRLSWGASRHLQTPKAVVSFARDRLHREANLTHPIWDFESKMPALSHWWLLSKFACVRARGYWWVLELYLLLEFPCVLIQRIPCSLQAGPAAGSGGLLCHISVT